MSREIFYRTFKNMDGPGLCQVWNRSCYADIKGKTLRADSFELFVASNLFFDPAHLVVAVESPEEPDPNGLFDGRIIGFVHGGFGPNQEMNGCDKSVGYIAMLIVENREDQQEVRARLLYEMEKIFFQMGIRTVIVGAVYPNAPFYTEEIFGWEQNGILENDPFLPQILLMNHYIAVERYRTLTFVLRNITPLNFSQRMLARNVELVTPANYSSPNNMAPTAPEASPTSPIPRDWWEICAHPTLEWNLFVLRDLQTREPIAWVGVRELSRGDVAHLLDLHHLYVKPQFRNHGYAKLLLTQVLNKLQRLFNPCQVELLVSERNTSAIQMFTGLHFETTSTGNVYRRELPEDFPETFQMDRSQEKGTEIHA